MALEHFCRRLDRLGDELAVALEIGEAQQRLAALPLAQILARPAQLEVALRDVDADLDHRGADEKLDLSGNEAPHHLCLLRRRQAAMQQSHLKLRKLAAQS